jgi:hypothetical protein
MQRRTHPPSLSSNRPTTPPSTLGGGLGALSNASFSGIGGVAKKPVKRGGKSGSGVLGPMWVMLFVILGMMGVSSWYWFPSQVTEAEKEALAGAQELGRKALQAEKEALAGAQEFGRKALEAEHRVEDWFHKTSENKDKNKQQQRVTGGGGGGSILTRPKLTSAEATARMLAQSSTWVDGEKKLKAKLKVLAERQQDGKDLGVPVLTRYLGEDIPAWVGEGVNEVEWRQQVEAKYAEMRVEEEQWKTRMQAIIDQRERDVGITTA